jgi:hypothetical protein
MTRRRLMIGPPDPLEIDEQGLPRIPDAEALAKFQPVELITDPPGVITTTNEDNTSGQNHQRRRGNRHR